MTDTARPRLVVVLCPERSGSTMLAAMLGGHCEVLAPPELHLWRYPHFDTWEASYPAAAASLDWLIARLGGDPVERRAGLKGQATGEVYERLLGGMPPGHILVDKTPAYAREDAVLARIEAMRPHYLWLLRHPLGVAASWLDREAQKIRGRQNRFLGPLGEARARFEMRRDRQPRIAAALHRWQDVHRRVDEFLAAIEPARRHALTYETLVRDPTSAIDEVCRFLAISPQPGMLDPSAHVAEPLGWGTGDGKAKATPAIDASRAEAWREVLSEEILSREITDLWQRLAARCAAPPSS